MNQNKRTVTGASLIQAFRNFLQKIRQNPEIYPIRYYKKNNRYRRTYKTHLYK
jgi:hypothetical protein